MKQRTGASLFRGFLPLAIFAVARFGFGAATEVIRQDSFSDLQEGEMEGVALTSDGFLSPSYARTEVGDTGTEIVWAAVPSRKDTVLCATGHNGKLVRVGGKSKVEIVADLSEPELTAMVTLQDGSTLVAAAPSGRIYRLDTDDKLTTYTQLQAKFVWNMTLDDHGNVWAATGTEGKVFKITTKDKQPKVEMACDLASHNIIDIWIDRNGLLNEKGAMYFAGQNPGWLYRFKDGDKKATVVYNAGSDEIRSLQPTKEGLALAMNSERAPSPQILNMTLRMAGAPPSVRAEPGGGAPPGGGGAPSGPPEDKAMGDVFSSPQKKGPPGPVSAVVLLTPDGYTRDLWNSPEKPIHSVSITPEGNLLVSAGGKGRLFEILPRHAFAVVADVKEDFIVKVTDTGKDWLLSTARNGLVIRMSRDRAKESIYRSKVLDTGSPVQWGHFHWHGDLPEGQSVHAAFRRGSTDDATSEGWSEWSKDEEVTTDRTAQISGPPARYLEYRLTFKQGRNSGAPLKTDSVDLYYRQPNRPPRVNEISVSDGGAPRGGSEGAPPPSPIPRPGSSRPSPGGPSGGGESGGSGPGSEAKAQGAGRAPHSNSGNITLSWNASDPNGDELIYALYFRASDEKEWKLIQDELKVARLPLGISGVADGRYRFRVVASDKMQNPPGAGLEGELVSEEVVIDNTPPVIEPIKVKVSGDHAKVTFKVVDQVSLIAAVTIDIDGGDAYPVPPTDGLLDEKTEEFDWTTLKLKDGEHVVTVGATDAKGNTSVQKVIFSTGK